MFNSICVGFDGSEPSENALRVACDLAAKYGASVDLVHTPKNDTVAFALGAAAGYYVATVMPSREEIAKAAEIVIDAAKKLAKETGYPDIACHIIEGEPAEVMIEHAKSCGADLIVTGRRGLGNLSALVLGSTSLEISHQAECAHLTVK